MSEYNVHRIRFIDYQPKSINSIAYNKENQKIAIAREDGSIEIRNIKSNMANDFNIPGKDGRSVEHVEWCVGNRLFSSGLTGEIIEWNLESLEPKYQQDSYGGPVWCIKFNHSFTKLAAGCEDGSIRLFNVEDDCIVYIRSLSVQTERILSLSWDANDEFIVSGGFGAICVYNVKNGQIITKISPEHKTKEDKTVVWAVEFLKNNYIVVGDSLGNTQFFCSLTYTLISSFKSHEADVLAVAISPDECTVFSTGIDSKVVKFCLDESEHGLQWKMVNHVKASDHDVRALVCCAEQEPFLISGGVDPRFIVYPLNDFKHSVKHSLLPTNVSFCSLAHDKDVIIFHDHHTVNGWQLAQLPSETKKYKKIFQINSNKHDHIICSSISNDANYVAYSTVTKNNILKIICGDNNTYSVQKISHSVPSAMCISFRNSDEVVCGCFDKKLHLFNIETMTHSQMDFNIDNPPSLPFTKITISKDGCYAAVSDALQKIYVFNLESQMPISFLPSMKGNITDFKFHPKNNHLFIITSLRRFYEFDVDNNKLLKWAKEITKKNILQSLGNSKYSVMNITINPNNNDEIFLQTKDKFGKLIYNKDVDHIPDPEDYESKRKRAKLANPIISVNHNYRDILFFDINNNGDIVLAEYNMEKTLQDLPEPLKLKRFGY